jgi:Branched-chain amino acid transport protein (AzlD)
MTLEGLMPYLLLIVVGFLPNEVWRFLGLVMVRGLDENSQIVLVARAVATAILAGVVAKLIFFSTGALASIPLEIRVGSAVGGFLVFLLARRSMLAGVLAGEALLIGGALVFG